MDQRDQAKAFEEAQARVKAGKDPLPDARSCFWPYGLSSGDPYLNIAYPDAATFYWGAVFTMPHRAKLHLEGKFPHARYIWLISYDFRGAPLDAVADYLLKPTAGSTNPYIDGADRSTKQRNYSIEVVNEPRPTPMRWGVHLKGEKRDRIHAPQQADNPQQQIQYRIYARDKATDETANGGLPEPVLTMPDGKVLRGAEACVQLRTNQPLAADLAALAMPRENLQKLIEEGRRRLGPNAPATNPPTWSKTSQETSRFAMYTGDFKVEPNVRLRDGTFYANLDNQYVRTFISRKFGDVWVMRAKAPTTPRTFNGDARWSDGGDLC